MSYQEAAAFAQSWGLIYFMLLFFGICAYALWPKNKDKFDRAARMPLDDQEQ